MMKYELSYEAIVFGIGIEDQYLDHIFTVEKIPERIQSFDKADYLFVNSRFFAGCFADDQKKSSYCIMKPKDPIVLLTNDEGDKLFTEVSNAVNGDLLKMEHQLMMILNIQVLFPQTKIFVKKQGSSECKTDLSSRPHLPLRLLKHDRYVNIQGRLALGFNWNNFYDFLNNKKHQRFKRAYDLYIQSFYESSCAASYCTLCASIEAITRNSKMGLKDRFAKYASILSCKLWNAAEEDEWRRIYALRSDYIHGKAVEINEQTEWAFRERVHAFIIGYYLFWINLNPANEQQFLSFLDDIYIDHSLYVKRAAAAYSFMQALAINSNIQGGLFSIPYETRALSVVASLISTMNKK